MFPSVEKYKDRIETLETALKGMTTERNSERDKITVMKRDHDFEIKTLKADHELEMRDTKAAHDLTLRDLKAAHEIALKTKQFEIDHNNSEELLAAKTKVNEATTKLAVAETKLEIMSKVTDVNADVLDVKDLVTKLIDKMPNINIDGIIAGLAGAGGGNKKPDAK